MGQYRLSYINSKWRQWVYVHLVSQWWKCCLSKRIECGIYTLYTTNSCNAIGYQSVQITEPTAVAHPRRLQMPCVTAATAAPRSRPRGTGAYTYSLVEWATTSVEPLF